MLFNSPQFLFLFLPAVLLVFFLLGLAQAYRRAAIWAAAASLCFYSMDSPARLLPIISVSIVFNYAVGRLLFLRRSRATLWVGIACNLLFLAWFKYAGFIAGNLAGLGLPIEVPSIILPIGISLYTFYPNRIPGGHVSRPGGRMPFRALRLVRQLFPASDRRTYPAS